MSKIIVIDPGHGGTDRKNRGPSGYVEADGVLKLSKYLQNFLNAIGFKALLTRDDDKTLGLSERAKIAHALKADLFISQHTNAGIGSNPACEVFESVNLDDDAFADQMSFLISNNLGIGNRGGKEWASTKYPGRDYLTVIDVSQRLGIKHVFLVETCNHDIPAGEKILKENKNLMISAICQGIVISRIFNIELNYSRELVLTTQKLLNNHGYGLKVDGYYGPKTGAAIMDFQEKKKLKLTGIPDLNLLKILDTKIDTREKTPDEILNECSVDPDGWQKSDIYLNEHLHELPPELQTYRHMKTLLKNAYYRRK
jgi:N-acetylmuramoyl-L-alanine amidase